MIDLLELRKLLEEYQTLVERCVGTDIEYFVEFVEKKFENKTYQSINLTKLKELCAEYDQVEGSYRESEFEGKSVFSFIENRIKDNSEWSDEYPTEEGFYWFFGEPFMGSMGGHFRGTVKPDIELNIVKMKFVGKKLLGQDRGQILYPHKWDGIKAGWMGKWRKMELPVLPSIESIK